MEKNHTLYRLNPVHIAPEAFGKRNNTTVTWLAGAGFLVNSRGSILFIDPLLSIKPENEKISEAGLELKIRLPLMVKDVPRADFVLYTHSDIDHLGPLTAMELAKLNLRFYGTYPAYYSLTQLGINPRQIDVCRIAEEFKIGDIRVEVIPADHPWQLKDLKRGGKPFRMGECCGYILNTPDGRIYFPGDTRLMEEHLKITNIDLLALDVSTDEYHLNRTSAIVLANNLPNAYLMPLHYGTYHSDFPAHLGDPHDVFSEVSNGDKRGLLLQPGEAFELKSFCL